MITQASQVMRHNRLRIKGNVARGEQHTRRTKAPDDRVPSCPGSSERRVTDMAVHWLPIGWKSTQREWGEGCAQFGPPLMHIMIVIISNRRANRFGSREFQIISALKKIDPNG